jgi:hypothetical protein
MPESLHPPPPRRQRSAGRTAAIFRLDRTQTSVTSLVRRELRLTSSVALLGFGDGEAGVACFPGEDYETARLPRAVQGRSRFMGCCKRLDG